MQCPGNTLCNAKGNTLCNAKGNTLCNAKGNTLCNAIRNANAMPMQCNRAIVELIDNGFLFFGCYVASPVV